MDCSIYTTVRRIGVGRSYILRVVETTLRTIRSRDVALSVHCIGDTGMRRLNSVYRGKDRTTDVLAFATQEGDVFDNHDWGDIFLSVPQITRQARANKIPYKQEFTRMLVHGILHLAGYDHIRPRDARKMLPLQENIIASLL